MSEVVVGTVTGNDDAPGESSGVSGDVLAGGGAEAGGGGAAAPEWLGGLPEDLRGDATLGRYKSLEDFARGHVELRKVAGSRVIVPAADADDATRAQFYEAIGRPKDAGGYEFEVPEGASPDLANGFREFAFATGMPKDMAEKAVKWNNEQIAAQQEAYLTSSQEAVAKVRAETPDYDTKITAAKQLFKSMGGDAAIADELDVKLGSENLVKFFIGLAEKTGEHGRVDGDRPGQVAITGDPEAQLDALQKDAGWRERFNAGDVEAVAQRERLMTAARNAANAKRQKPG
jgi:hypothetical protein